MKSTMQRITLAVTVLLLTSTLARAETMKETFTQTYPLQPGSTVEVSNQNGAVVVEAWDRPEVRLEAEKTARGGMDREAVAKAFEQLRVEVNRNGNTLSFKTLAPRKSDGIFHWLAGSSVDTSIAYTLHVPRRSNLEVETVNGKVRVRAVEGAIRTGTVNGAIEVLESAGHVSGKTVNGSIHVQLPRATNANGMSFRTTNGGVHLELPTNFRAQLDASTVNGSIKTDLPVTIVKHSRNNLRGSLNGGGPALEIKTVNGSIRITESGS